MLAEHYLLVLAQYLAVFVVVLAVFRALAMGVEAVPRKVRRLAYRTHPGSAAAVRCPNCGADTGRTADTIALDQVYRCGQCEKEYVGSDLL